MGGHAAWLTTCPPYYTAQACIQPHYTRTQHRTTPEEDTQASPKASTQHGEQQIPVISHRSTGVERSTRDHLVGGRDFLLDSCRPPQAGQPPASKVLSRHGVPSSLGAWGLGQVVRNYRTRQENKKQEQDQL